MQHLDKTFYSLESGELSQSCASVAGWESLWLYLHYTIRADTIILIIN